MATDIRLKEGLPEITEALMATYAECKHINHLGHKPLPSREAIVDILADFMDILYLLIPLSLVLVLLIGAVFWWAVDNGQFEDLEGPAHRILHDDDRPSP